MNFINVNALLSDLTDMYKSDFRYNLGDIIHYIGKYPTVRTDTYIPNSKWIEYRKGHYTGVKCVKCDTIMDFRTNFCPNCGASMQNGNQKAPTVNKCDNCDLMFLAKTRGE